MVAQPNAGRKKPETRYTATLRSLDKIPSNLMSLVKGVHEQLGDGPFTVEKVEEVDATTAAFWRSKNKVKIEGKFYLGTAFDLHKIGVR